MFRGYSPLGSVDNVMKEKQLKNLGAGEMIFVAQYDSPCTLIVLPVQSHSVFFFSVEE